MLARSATTGTRIVRYDSISQWGHQPVNRQTINEGEQRHDHCKSQPRSWRRCRPGRQGCRFAAAVGGQCRGDGEQSRGPSRQHCRARGCGIVRGDGAQASGWSGGDAVDSACCCGRTGCGVSVDCLGANVAERRHVGDVAICWQVPGRGLGRRQTRTRVRCPRTDRNRVSCRWRLHRQWIVGIRVRRISWQLGRRRRLRSRHRRQRRRSWNGDDAHRRGHDQRHVACGGNARYGQQYRRRRERVRTNASRRHWAQLERHQWSAARAL